MRAILFDPFEKDTTEVDVESWEGVKALIGCDILTEFTITQGEIDGKHCRVVMFLDDEGLLRDDIPVMMFQTDGLYLEQPLAGKCVLASYHVDEEGDLEMMPMLLPLEKAKILVRYSEDRTGDYKITTTVREGDDGAIIRQKVEKATDAVSGGDK